jgi:uncharacterized membrane protein
MAGFSEFGKLESRFTEDGKFIRTDAWRKEGKWVDLWSALHVLSGVAIGFYPRYFGFSMIATFVIVLLLLVMYEMFEVIVKIEEYPSNRFTDVLFGMLGFAPAYFFDRTLDPTASVITCVVVTTAAVIVAIIAWTSSYKAFELEKKMRVEYERNRVRMLARRDRIRARLDERRKRRTERRMS